MPESLSALPPQLQKSLDDRSAWCNSYSDNGKVVLYTISTLDEITNEVKLIAVKLMTDFLMDRRSGSVKWLHDGTVTNVKLNVGQTYIEADALKSVEYQLGKNRLEVARGKPEDLG